MYIRKTEDIYYIMANYGYGWEELYWLDNYQEAKDDLKSYRENEKNAQFYILKKRVKK